jgi:NADH-quinone oxidoreductase subunit F
MATIPPIIDMGGAEYAKLGRADSRGTRVVSISGHVERPGNYEIENGTSVRSLIYDLGGGILGGRELKAVIPGGSSTVILRYDEIDVGYDFNSLAALNTAMGSAGVVVLDDRCCMVQLGIRISEFYEHESCGKVHAVPRGHALDDADPAPARGRRGGAARARPAALGLRPDQR